MVKLSGWLFICSAAAFTGAALLGEFWALYVLASLFFIIGIVQLARTKAE
ncbi:hypothetical protein AAEU32_12205 [Pseudoalteromonas sp. SSDWG2]